MERSKYELRMERLRHMLCMKGADAFLATQNVDIYYLTGSMQQGYLWVPAEGKPLFYVRRSVERAMAESAAAVEPLGSLKAWGATVAAQLKPGSTILTEYDVLPVQSFERLQAAVGTGCVWADGTSVIRELRMVKDASELASIRSAAAVVDEALRLSVGKLHVGMTELAFMAEFEYAIRQRGHFGMMRMRAYNQELVTGLAAAGAAAAMPTFFDGPAGGQGPGPGLPVGSGPRPIGRNEPLLIDVGCCIDGYVIDQTRTAVIGKLDTDLQAAYVQSEHILRETERKLLPGTVCETLYTEALSLAEAAGLEQHFMGWRSDQVKFLGHGIGLEIDEWPVLAKGFRHELAAGMVLAIEPKFTFPERGVVGIENSYAITDSGYEKLTVSQEGIWEV